jgi:hypothetical protein
MAQTYIDMLAPFVPDESAPAGVPEQEFFYTLIKGLYQLAFEEPLLFVAATHEDDAYPNRFHKSSYGKPELQANMKKMTKAVDTLLQNMFNAGQSIDVRLDRRQQVILSRLGINDLKTLPPAWVWMSSRPEASLTFFRHCMFRKGYPYTSDIYARLLGEKPFRRLEGRLTEKGYKNFDIYDLVGSDCKLSLTYANPAWSAERPRGGFEYKIRHTGISMRYDAFIKEPCVFGLCIPNGLKTYLTAFDEMNEKTRNFVISHTKKCDGCRYCVQTDKTGSRPLAIVKASHEGKNYNLCPYFPGFSYCWTSLDDALADQLLEMLSFMDKFAPA